MRKTLWALSLIGAVISGFCIVGAILAESAPQQAASAAIGAVLAIAPYCLARAFDEFWK